MTWVRFITGDQQPGRVELVEDERAEDVAADGLASGAYVVAELTRFLYVEPGELRRAARRAAR